MSQHEPTDEQLERAWHELAKPEWGTFAEVRAAARHYSLVRARATALASGRTPVVVDAPAPAPAPASSLMGSLKVSHQPAGIDRKRAAAGDRDDDCPF